jgi:hypothetical protein
MVARHRRLVDLQHRAAGGLQVAQLGIERRRDVEREFLLVVVKFVGGAVDHRHRPRHRHLQRPRRVRFGKAQIVDRGRRAPHDPAGNARHQPIGGSVAVDFLDRRALGIDAVPAAGDMKDESRAPHLAVGEKIEAKLLLLADDQRHGVVHGRSQLIALQPEAELIALGMGEPTRPRKAADTGRGQWEEGHELRAPVLPLSTISASILPATGRRSGAWP